MQYIFYAILLYLLYRFITGFVIPVARTTSQVKRQFEAMRQQANAEGGSDAQQGNRSGYANVHPSQKPKYDVEGEYIQFEEVK